MPENPAKKPKVHRFRIRPPSPTKSVGHARRSASPVRVQQVSTSPAGHSLHQVDPEDRPLRGVLSCDRCRIFKKKCSRTFPSCSLCEKAGKLCSLSTSPAPPESSLSQLEARVAWLSSIVNANLSLPIGRGIEGVDTGTQFPLRSDTPRAQQDGHHLKSSASNQRGGLELTTAPQTDHESVPNVDQPDMQIAGRSDLGGHIQSRPETNTYQAASDSPCSNTVVKPHGYWWKSHAKSTSVGSCSSHVEAHGALPEAFARQCVEAYFQHVHRAYPFVNRAKIEAQIGGSESQGPLGATGNAQSTLFHLVIGIGYTTLKRAGKLPEDTSPPFKIIYSSVVQEYMSGKDIESLQNLVLVALHSLFEPQGMSAWAVAGIASRQAILLGLSRQASEKDSKSSLEIENRHRLFWSIWVLDRMMAFALGLPVALTDEKHDIPLPGLTVEEFESMDRQAVATMLQTNRHVIKLRQLQDRILRQILLRKATDVANMSHVDCQSLTQAIRADIEDWYSNGCLVSPLEADSIPIHGSIAWSSSRYYHLLFFLHYPCPFNLKRSKSLAKELYSLVQKSLQINLVLLQQRQLPLNRVTLCQLLPVGLVLMHCLAQGETSASPNSGRQDITALVQILEAFPSSWTEAHDAAKIFRSFLQHLSLASIMGDRVLPSAQPNESYTTSMIWSSSAEPAPLLRSSIHKFTELMRHVLGMASCYLFEELPLSEPLPHSFVYANQAVANSSFDSTLCPPQAVNGQMTDQTSLQSESWQFSDLAFL